MLKQLRTAVLFGVPLVVAVLNHIGTNPSRKNPKEIVAYRATRFQGIATAEILGLKTLLLLGTCCPTALITLPFSFSSKEDSQRMPGFVRSTS
jgi:hypothetical protein